MYFILVYQKNKNAIPILVMLSSLGQGRFGSGWFKNRGVFNNLCHSYHNNELKKKKTYVNMSQNFAQPQTGLFLISHLHLLADWFPIALKMEIFSLY